MATKENGPPAHEVAAPAADLSGRPALPGEVDAWLLDGFNVLHAVLLGGQSRGRFWQRSERERLVARLVGAPGDTRPPGEIVVVFDGAHPVEGEAARPGPGVEVVFAPSADDWIVRRVRRSERPERIGVVTNDRQVAGRSRHAGARIVAPASFLAACPDLPSADADTTGSGPSETPSESPE